MPDEKAVEQKTVSLEALDHNGQRRIALRFPYNSELIATAKSIGANGAAPIGAGTWRMAAPA